MRKVGLIGGMSWVSTRTYYDHINRIVQLKVPSPASAPLLIESLDFSRLYRVTDEEGWEEAAKVLEPVKQYLAAQGIEGYTTQLRHGYAPEEIVAAAKDVGAGLIVMGTHGHGMFGRALMGSVATKVIAESPVSVLLVK